MRCPREGTPLVASPFLGVTMDSCPNCDGTFLDAGELALIHGMAEDVVQGEALDTQDPKGSVACPKCSASMVTRWFSPSRRTIIDRCPTCEGIWLDTAELKLILNEAWSAGAGA